MRVRNITLRLLRRIRIAIQIRRRALRGLHRSTLNHAHGTHMVRRVTLTMLITHRRMVQRPTRLQFLVPSQLHL